MLTQQGLEVEGIETKGRELYGVVVAEVLGLRPHPKADRLRIVRVRAGGDEEEVVCGAPNVPPAGGRVAWARPGLAYPASPPWQRARSVACSRPGCCAARWRWGSATRPRES